MTEKLRKKERQQLRSLVLECQLRRFTTVEALHFIKDKLHVSISESYYFRVRKQIIEDSTEQLHYYEDNKNAFVATYFERIASAQKIERELWSTYYELKEEKKDPNLQLKSLLYLKEVGEYLTDLHSMLPELSGLHFESDRKAEKEKDYDYSKPQLATEMHPGEYSRECKF
jgi:hypothetical protein